MMKKYKVELLETVSYTVTVEAENDEQACEYAADIWAESPTPTADFEGWGHGVEVYDYNLITEG